MCGVRKGLAQVCSECSRALGGLWDAALGESNRFNLMPIIEKEATILIYGCVCVVGGEEQTMQCLQSDIFGRA